MNKINKLIKDYENYEFSSGGITGEDYKSFQRKYKNVLKNIAKNINGELINFSGNHYYFSTFVEKDNKYVYISISDVRHFPNNWRKNILFRTAKNKKDYSGGHNQYTTIDNLEEELNKIL